MIAAAKGIEFVSGVVQNCPLASLRVLGSNAGNYVSSFTYKMNELSIYNCSSKMEQGNLYYDWSEEYRAAEASISGRNGKGTVVTAAGNYGDKKDYVTLDMSKNNRYYITVGATGYFKTVAAYSETGSSLMCVAPGGNDTALNPEGNKTTDFVNDFGYPHLFISDSKISDGMGTSYACPMVTGCIALLLSQGDNNTKLSWRDVKELISISCDNTIDPTSYADIKTSVKNIWFTNGAGRKYNINYGYGLLDCKKLIDNSVVGYYLLKNILGLQILIYNLVEK